MGIPQPCISDYDLEVVQMYAKSVLCGEQFTTPCLCDTNTFKKQMCALRNEVQQLHSAVYSFKFNLSRLHVVPHNPQLTTEVCSLRTEAEQLYNEVTSLYKNFQKVNVLQSQKVLVTENVDTVNYAQYINLLHPSFVRNEVFTTVNINSTILSRSN